MGTDLISKHSDDFRINYKSVLNVPVLFLDETVLAEMLTPRILDEIRRKIYITNNIREINPLQIFKGRSFPNIHSRSGHFSSQIIIQRTF